ncbi:hypothetical protein [Helicobacter cetorum]|uniref:hypothetical protein n=1 Tax=Helicobacter cetorum TaxID=138563 RepID=UPI0018F842AA|nr:hypothetical protein [Helicobacter cetorum]
MKTSLLKGLGALSLALAMPLFGGAPIDVSTEIENGIDRITYKPYQETYLKISSNADNVVIQNIELNRGNCKSEVDSNTSLKSYERKRNKLIQQIKNVATRMNSKVEDKSKSSKILDNVQIAKEQIEGVKAFQKEVQKELDTINTYEELENRKEESSSILHVDNVPNEEDAEGFQSIVPKQLFGSYMDMAIEKRDTPKSKELYSIRLFVRSIRSLYILFLDNSGYERDLETFVSYYEHNDYDLYCESNYGHRPFTLKSCIKSNPQAYKYYLEDYIKSIIGEKDYNQLTDENYWISFAQERWNFKNELFKKHDGTNYEKLEEEYLKEQINKFKPYLDNIEQKLDTAYLQKYKEIALNLVNLEAKKELRELSEFIKKQQQAYPQIQQQEQKENQQRQQKRQQKGLEEAKRLAQKLTQVNQKIKEMKEQGNIIEIPLKFGEVFSMPVCENLKEAKIKTNKGTDTYTFFGF